MPLCRSGLGYHRNFVTWDDWSWYDHVAPPKSTNSALARGYRAHYRRMRSPIHLAHQYSSRRCQFIEARYGFLPLTARDAARTIYWMLSILRKPRFRPHSATRNCSPVSHTDLTSHCKRWEQQPGKNLTIANYSTTTDMTLSSPVCQSGLHPNE